MPSDLDPINPSDPFSGSNLPDHPSRDNLPDHPTRGNFPDHPKRGNLPDPSAVRQHRSDKKDEDEINPHLTDDDMETMWEHINAKDMSCPYAESFWNNLMNTINSEMQREQRRMKEAQRRFKETL